MKINSSVLIQSVLTGMGIGFPVTLVCMIAIGGMNSVIREFLVWMIASAIYGLLTAIMFFRNSDLPFPISLGLHCIECLAVTAGACSLLGYGTSVMELVIGILPVFVVIYAVVYGVCFAVMKHHERKINEALNQQ